jgi:hypothetical protein
MTWLGVSPCIDLTGHRRISATRTAPFYQRRSLQRAVIWAIDLRTGAARAAGLAVSVLAPAPTLALLDADAGIETFALRISVLSHSRFESVPRTAWIDCTMHSACSALLAQSRDEMQRTTPS